MADHATLYWGVIGIREGWWLRKPDGAALMVHGPSICLSSGGGPMAAQEAARAQHDWHGLIEIKPPPEHEPFGETVICTACVNSIFSN